MVVLIGLVFFALQLYSCLRFFFRMRRHEVELARLLGDLGGGGEGRDVELFAISFPWLKWVDTNFPRGSTTPANYTREDVLKELDTRIASDGAYVFLQRCGIMAPLLGVIITVVGFWFLSRSHSLDIPEGGRQSLSDILYTVTPLVAGVGTGALLAFVNQLLLHLAGRKVEAVRNAARAWFDAAIWSHVGLDTQAATVKSITAMEKMARTVLQSAERQEKNSEILQESSAAIQRAAATLQEACGTFGDRLRGLPETLQQLTATAHAAIDTLQSLVPAGELLVAGLDVSVASFRTAIDTQFVEAVRSHHASTDTLAESVGRINESSERLKISSTDLQETVNAHTNAFKSLNRSLQQQVLPAHEAFLATIKHFNGQAEGLVEQLERLHSEVIASLEKMTSLAPEAADAVAKFSRSTATFSDAVQHRFGPAAEGHQNNALAVAASVQQLQQAARGLSDGNLALGQLLDGQVKLGRELAAVYGTLRQAVERLAETGRLLNQSYETGLLPSQRSVGQAAETLADSSRRLAAAVHQGVDPVTARLAELDDTLRRFSATARAIQEFTAARGDIERLTQSLAQAAAVTDAIAALPGQMRCLLEELVAQGHAEAAGNAKGGWTAWFRGRRR